MEREGQRALVSFGLVVLASLVLALLLALTAGTAAAAPAGAESPFVEVGRLVRPAVVSIRTVRAVTCSNRAAARFSASAASG